MSTIITGDPSTVSSSLSATITGATNASPIVITTSAAHLFSTYDIVYITGVTGNTAANGVFAITVLSATTFSLTGSTGNGAYVSGGTAVDMSLTPACQVPTNGDDFDADAVISAVELCLDRTQFLVRQSPVQYSSIVLTSTQTMRVLRTGRYLLESCGGGGGGGGGRKGGLGAGTEGGGSGSGGGAGTLGSALVNLTAGDLITFNAGGGGAGGAGGTTAPTNPTDGSAGSPSYWQDALSATVCMGMGGGGGTKGLDAGAPTHTIGGLSPNMYAGTSTTPETLVQNQGQGGCGRWTIAGSQPLATDGSQAGAPSVCAAGGAAGADGTKSGSYGAGSGGGGGGASAHVSGSGGAGGAGGNAASAGTATAGAAGSAGAYGSGGGGGGGGGAGSIAAANGGAGAAGGDGWGRMTFLGATL